MAALFSTFGIDWRELIAQMINFGILVAALTWLLYKPVLKMVRERERVVAKGVEDATAAARALAESDDIAASRINAAEKTADGIMKGARSEASEERAKILREAEARAAEVAKDAQARAAEAAARGLRESEREIARLALLAAEKVIKKKRP